MPKHRQKRDRDITERDTVPIDSRPAEAPEHHPARNDADDLVTHPLNPPPERRSQRRAQRDERPGS